MSKISVICNRCNGTGKEWIDIRRLRLGPGAVAFLTAGVEPQRGDDGSKKYQLVCCRCDGAGVLPDPKGGAS